MNIFRIAFCMTVFLAGTVRGGNRSPNILFIMTDDLGIQDLGCCGSDYYRTPHLDELAAQGMRFCRSYAAASLCSPTRAAVMTGRYPHRVHLTDALPWDRLPDNPEYVPPNHLKELPTDYITFAQVLRRAGYKTALFGKWHLGNEHSFFDLKGHEAYGFDEAFDADYHFINKVDKGTGVLTDRSLTFLEENKENPFMLCLFYHTPHIPLACPPDYEAAFEDSPPGTHQNNRKYAGMISHLDDSVQALLDKLSELGLDQNTVVVFTSDNGGFTGTTSNAPFRGGKANLYEGGIRVPLLVRWPGVVAPGSVCDVPVISTDYFPTFLEMAGLDKMPKACVDGQSMAPLLAQVGTNHPRNLFWHLPHYRPDPQSAVLSKGWKLVHQIVPDSFELYHLNNDPYETRDLSGQYPEMTDRLRMMLEKQLRESGAQRMRNNIQWNSEKPRGDIRNYGVFYPAGGGIYRQVTDPLPEWFKAGAEK